MREHVLLFCLLGLVLIGSGVHSRDHTGDRTGGRDLGAGPHRMSCRRQAGGARSNLSLTCARFRDTVTGPLFSRSIRAPWGDVSPWSLSSFDPHTQPRCECGAFPIAFSGCRRRVAPAGTSLPQSSSVDSLVSSLGLSPPVGLGGAFLCASWAVRGAYLAGFSGASAARLAGLRATTFEGSREP
jgi:hypothetical protein